MHRASSVLLNLQENPSTPNTEKTLSACGASAQQKKERAYYVEEQFAAISGVILRADPVLDDLVSIVKQFERHLTAMRLVGREEDQHGSGNILNIDTERELAHESRKRLKVSFSNEQEINELRKQSKTSFFKHSIVRTSLGVVKAEDWIFKLGIQNILELNFLTMEELSGTSQKLESYLEVARDSMLEKIVLISVAYFCIATEMRFLAKS